MKELSHTHRYSGGNKVVIGKCECSTVSNANDESLCIRSCRDEVITERINRCFFLIFEVWSSKSNSFLYQH